MSIDHIKKIYIEPTAKCNFNTYQTLISQARDISSLDTIFFGGIAEPMAHKDIYKMIEMAKSLGVKTELITNGSMINEDAIEKLLRAGLDMLWFSIDSAHNDSYETNLGAGPANRAELNLLAFNS
jgi:MoaA/NifB/PqqE/SkfB family radical SAM enzyme